MLKFYVESREAVRRLRDDKRGVTAFEYVIVAACVVAAVGAAFGPGSSGAIEQALSSGISTVVSLVNTNV